MTPEIDVPFIIGDWNVKVGTQEVPGVTGKFGLEVQSEAVQRLTSSAKRTHIIGNALSTTQEMILHVDIAVWSTQKSDGLYLCS